MATWETLRNHIKSNYNVSKDELTILSLQFDVGGGRTQVVVVAKSMLGDYEWAQIGTPVCTEADLNPRDALLRNWDFVVGALVMMDNGTVWFRHSLPLKTSTWMNSKCPSTSWSSSATDSNRSLRALTSSSPLGQHTICPTKKERPWRNHQSRAPEHVGAEAAAL